jgi:phosphoribosyl 1,2-cyclic phosphodiesterase
MKPPAQYRSDQFIIKFWGTRGTRMVAGDKPSLFGQQTICVEVTCGERTLVFDAGSGIVRLGRQLIADKIHNFDLFLSHAHYDHVEGIPFFQPFYEKDFTVNFWSGKLKGIERTRDIVDGLMKEPYFPIRQEKFHARIRYHEIADHQILDLGNDIELATMRLHHPGGATGYRVSYKGRKFAFVTDTTHSPGNLDRDVLEFIQGVDLFAYDCSYTDAEFPQFANFGHSTWEEAIRLKENSGAKAMLGLHHMPFRTDEQLMHIRKSLLAGHKECDIATDGLTVKLG